MSDDHTGVLLEDLQDKIKQVLEATAALAGVPAQLQAIEARLSKVEANISGIKTIITVQQSAHQGRKTRSDSASKKEPKAVAVDLDLNSILS